MKKLIWILYIILLYIIFSCKQNIRKNDRSLEVFETDSSKSVTDLIKENEIYTLYYNKEKNQVKGIDYYSINENVKNWMYSITFYPNGKIKDSIVLTKEGLFYEIYKYNNNGVLLEKNENILASNELNQYWYFNENGKLLEDYGVYHEVVIITQKEINFNKELRFKFINGFDGYCEEIHSFDLQIGEFNDAFNSVDTNKVISYQDLKFNDTITWTGLKKGENILRYKLFLKCKAYKYEGEKRNNVKIPISGIIYFNTQ